MTRKWVPTHKERDNPFLNLMAHPLLGEEDSTLSPQTFSARAQRLPKDLSRRLLLAARQRKGPFKKKVGSNAVFQSALDFF
jgi:hypothetical protein